MNVSPLKVFHYTVLFVEFISVIEASKVDCVPAGMVVYEQKWPNAAPGATCDPANILWPLTG